VPSHFEYGGYCLVHQYPEVDQVTTQPVGEQTDTQSVAYLQAAPNKRLLLGDAPPLTGQYVRPQVRRIPSQPAAGRRQLAGRVVEDAAGGEFSESLP
jgi:hypothetical protein